MAILQITPEKLRTMSEDEGLIIQGCGGSLQEWLDGINDVLTKEEILLEGTKFNDAYTFKHDNLTCLLFKFSDDVKLHMGKLAMWRLKTHGTFAGTWLSNYVPNTLGGFIKNTAEKVKPDCPLIGQDGNTFNLMGIAAKTLNDNNMTEEAMEMTARVMSSGSYGEALNIIGEYVNITSVDDDEAEDFSDDEGEGQGMSL